MQRTLIVITLFAIAVVLATAVSAWLTWRRVAGELRAEFEQRIGQVDCPNRAANLIGEQAHRLHLLGRRVPAGGEREPGDEARAQARLRHGSSVRRRSIAWTGAESPCIRWAIAP